MYNDGNENDEEAKKKNVFYDDSYDNNYYDF